MRPPRHDGPRHPPALLALPGWDDDGKQQFDALNADLSALGWTCRRAHLPDTSWSSAERASETRDDSLRRALHDHDMLGGVETGSLALLGFSYGGYIAALLAGARPVDWLVLRSPAIYPDADWALPKEELDKRALDDYRQRLLAPEDNNALRCCAGFRGHVLLVYSEFDEVIAPPVMQSYAQAFVQARSLTRHTLPGADHQLSKPGSQRAYHALVVRWLSERKNASL